MNGHGIDVLIRDARVVDGSGNPWFHADVVLSGDRIAGVLPPGRVAAENAAEIVEAAGMVLAPGFIDIQSHSIIPLMRDPRCLSKIMQGVTTEIMGEAWTPAPVGGSITDPLALLHQDMDPGGWREQSRNWRRFGDWLAALENRGVSPNVGSFLGGGTLREYVRGLEIGASTEEQLEVMRRVMAEAMEDGAFGVSYALIYPPDAYAGTDEIVEVCKVVAHYGGIYITHMRSEADALIEGIEEALDISLRANLPVEIYHLKAAGRRNWEKMPRVIEMIDAARQRGLDVTADMYPYVGSGTGLSSVLPPWLAEGGKFYQNLRDPEIRARARAEALNPSGGWEAMGGETGPEGIMPLDFDREENQVYVGKRLSEIAALRGQEWVDAAIDLLVSEEQRIFTVYFGMDEANLLLQMRQPWMKISTDAGGLDPAWAAERGPTHPRAYGTYPRVLGKYVREEKVIPLEDAIRKMTSAVAERIGLRDRGLVREGCFADIVIFDPETIADRATFEDPHRLADGVRDIWINGERVVRAGEHTGATPGRVVKGVGALLHAPAL